MKELEDIGLENTPQYNPHNNEKENKQMFSQLAKEMEPMIEVEDQYTGEDIMLPRGNEVASGQVMAQKCGINENEMSRAHTNHS